MVRTTFISLIVIFCSLHAFAIADDDISGTWVMTFESPRGEVTREINISQDGEKIQITFTSRRGEEISISGSFKEGVIAWTEERTGRGRTFVVDYTGKLSEGTFSGTMKMGEDREGKWTAKKKAE